MVWVRNLTYMVGIKFEAKYIWFKKNCILSGPCLRQDTRDECWNAKDGLWWGAQPWNKRPRRLTGCEGDGREHRPAAQLRTVAMSNSHDQHGLLNSSWPLMSASASAADIASLCSKFPNQWMSSCQCGHITADRVIDLTEVSLLTENYWIFHRLL